MLINNFKTNEFSLIHITYLPQPKIGKLMSTIQKFSWRFFGEDIEEFLENILQKPNADFIRSFHRNYPGNSSKLICFCLDLFVVPVWSRDVYSKVFLVRITFVIFIKEFNQVELLVERRLYYFSPNFGPPNVVSPNASSPKSFRNS